MNKSTPMPASANLPAVFRQSAWSVVKSFRSASVPCTLGSSRITNAPGPEFGRLDTAAMTFPPVACRADNAAFSAGSNATSGVLT